jgi:macrolide-specific efflux system membrane fusion protein
VKTNAPNWRSGVVLNSALVVLVAAGGVWAYQLVKGASPSSPTANSGGTRTATVTQGEVLATVSATGSVQSATTAAADFVTGGTVISISVHIGDTVQQGQELARVDPASSQESLDTANANLAAAQASLTRAEAGTDNAVIASAQAQVTTASAAVDTAQRALTGTILTAPMAGTVTAINGSVGATASGSGGSTGSGGGGSSTSSSSSGFIQLADLTKMQASASFAEADATRLKNGQAATVTWMALNNTTATGKVTTISPTATTVNNVNTYAVTVSIDTQPDGVRLGQTVNVTVTVGDATNVLRVPSAAVRTVGNRSVVTVVANGQNVITPVQTGVLGDTYTEITSGLDLGQVVVIVTAPTTSTTGGAGGGGLGGGGFVGGGGRGGAAGGGGGGRAGG